MLTIGLICRSVQLLRPDPNLVLTYAKRFKTNTSLVISYNDSLIADVNSQQRRPIIDTWQILIAITYADQLLKEKIDENQKWPKAALNRWYLKGADPGHRIWLKQIEDKEELSLEEILKEGMMEHGSLACSGFLMDLLGLEAINRWVDSLKLANHDTLYPVTGTLMAPLTIPGKDWDESILYLEKSEMAEYIHLSEKGVEMIKSDSVIHFKDALLYPDFDIHQLWCERLPQGTALDYLKVLQWLNKKEKNPSTLQGKVKQLFPVFSFPDGSTSRLRWKNNRAQWSKYYLLFGEDNQGNQWKMLFFFHNIDNMYNRRLEGSFPYFIEVLMKQTDFLESFVTSLEKSE